MNSHNLPPLGLSLLALAALWTCTLTAADNTAAGKRHLITDAGAVGDGQTLNTKAIQAVIDQCVADGGGVVVVPKGVFLSGALFFKNGANLLVEQDGVLKGSVNPEDYPQVNTRWEGVEREWTCAFLNFNNMTNVVVSGAGMIDGSGDLWMQRGGGGPRRGPGGAAPTNAPPMPAANAAANPAGTNAPARRGGMGRPRMICFTSCKNVLIADLHLQRQAVWCLHLLYSEDVVATNLNIRAIERIPSSDGIDVDSCHNVQITRCDIACNDDDIAIKCGKDADGLRVNRPSENITISDCQIGAGAGITMGSEVSGSIRHVLVEHCHFNGCDAAVRFKSQPSRGGVIEDIVYRDIDLTNVGRAAEFLMAWRMVGPAVPPAKVLTEVRDVQLINITGSVRNLGVMTGLKDSPIHDVKFVNCKLSAQRGLTLENCKDIDVSGLQATVAEGETVINRDAPAAPKTQP